MVVGLRRSALETERDLLPFPDLAETRASRGRNASITSEAKNIQGRIGAKEAVVNSNQMMPLPGTFKYEDRLVM